MVAVFSMQTGALGPVLAKLRDRYPQLMIKVMRGMSIDLAKRVENGELDAVVMSITVNMLCVSVFSLTNPDNGGFQKLPKQLATNPLILGCVAGLSLNLSGIGLYQAMASIITAQTLLAFITLPLTLAWLLPNVH